MRSLDFRIDDCTFRLDTNDNALLVEVVRDLSHIISAKRLSADRRARVIKSQDTFPIEVPKYAVRDSIGPDESAIYTHSDRRYVKLGDHYIFEIDLNARTVEGYFRPGCTIWTFFRSILKWFVIKNLEGKGLHFLHASAALRDDLSIFFVAPSGFGKTSALLSLLGRGYLMVADDLVLLDNETVQPFHMRSMIHYDMTQRFPSLLTVLDDPSASDVEGGWHLDLEHLFPVVHEPYVPQKTILIHLYVWNSPKTEWKVITRNQMFAEMCNSYLIELANSFWFGWNKEQITKEVFNSYFDLCERAKCYEVYAGRDVDEFEQSVFRLIESEAD
jgi:hypothetical protein